MATENMKIGGPVPIAVMGVTGAGKSSLIRTITGRNDIKVGKGLRSETTRVTPYDFEHNGTLFVLIDTPGFNDTDRSDTEILQDVVSWLADQYDKGSLLSGIIYLHPITSPRVQGSTMTQIRVFKELCGEEFYDDVILGTTFWGKTDEKEAEAREEELFSTLSFLGDMKDFGAKTVRVLQDRSSCLKLIENFARKEKTALKIQKDLAKAGATFETTRVATALSAELNQLHLEHEKELEKARNEAAEIEKENARQLKREEQLRLQRLKKKEQEKDRERVQLREREKEAERQRQEKIKKEKQLEEKRRREAAAIQEQKRKREEEARQKEIALQKQRQEAELEAQRRRHAQELQELRQRLEREKQSLIRHSRLSLHRRGDGLFDSYKSCGQRIHTTTFMVKESLKCIRCKVVVCWGCYNRGEKIAHYAGCFYQQLPG